jgi:hypothetical protein
LLPSPTGPRPAHYSHVTGSVSPDQKRLELRGKAPLLDAACVVTGTRDEVLVFRAPG